VAWPRSIEIFSPYSAPVRLTVVNPAGGPDWTAQLYLQNPAPARNPENSRGAGYPTTDYFVLPADYLGPGGALRLRVARLAEEPNHVPVNGESLHFDAPRPTGVFAAAGSEIAGWHLAARPRPHRLRRMALLGTAARAAGCPGPRPSGDRRARRRGGLQHARGGDDFRNRRLPRGTERLFTLPASAAPGASSSAASRGGRRSPPAHLHRLSRPRVEEDFPPRGRPISRLRGSTMRLSNRCAIAPAADRRSSAPASGRTA
jgi:hypothetical protein